MRKKASHNMDSYVAFRRAGVIRELGRVFIETAPNQRWYLMGTYDPGMMLSRVVAARYVNLDHWSRNP